MLIRLALSALVLILCSSSALLAQDEIKGQYVTSAATADTMHLPDGRILTAGRYGQFVFTDDPSGIFNTAKGDCSSWQLTDPSMPDDPGTFAGHCFNLDADGDANWFWWRMEEAGTEDCPLYCGVWGVSEGTGKFEGMTGGGTWKAKTMFPDGSNRGVFTFKRM